MGGIVTAGEGTSFHGGYNQPRLATGASPDVSPGSPLAVIGLWVAALRNRFNYNTAEPLPWVWSADLKPSDTESGQPLPDEPRKLQIESAYVVEKSVRNYRPSIYVDRGAASCQKIMIDNRAGTRRDQYINAYHCLVHMPVVFTCESESAGESSVIADTAWFFVLATRDLFRQSFGFHDISEPVLGPTQQVNEDKTVWSTDVQFTVQFDARWLTRPMAPFIADISIQVSDIGDPDIVYGTIATRDIGTTI